MMMNGGGGLDDDALVGESRPRLSARELKEQEREQANAQRQQTMLQLLKNIPWIEVSVTAALAIKEGKESYTAYEISLCVPKDAYKAASYTVQHRYSRFVQLHDALVKAWGRQVELPKLPPKSGMFGLSRNQIDQRQAALHSYLKNLVTVLNWSVEPIRTFFECDRWLRERKTRSLS